MGLPFWRDPALCCSLETEPLIQFFTFCLPSSLPSVLSLSVILHPHISYIPPGFSWVLLSHKPTGPDNSILFQFPPSVFPNLLAGTTAPPCLIDNGLFPDLIIRSLFPVLKKLTQALLSLPLSQLCFSNSSLISLLKILAGI